MMDVFYNWTIVLLLIGAVGFAAAWRGACRRAEEAEAEIGKLWRERGQMEEQLKVLLSTRRRATRERVLGLIEEVRRQ